MTNGPRGHFGGALQHVKSRRNHGQSMFKELAKELHQDPAVLSRGLIKLAESWRVNRSCVAPWPALRQLEEGKAAQKINQVSDVMVSGFDYVLFWFCVR